MLERIVGYCGEFGGGEAYCEWRFRLCAGSADELVRIAQVDYVLGLARNSAGGSLRGNWNKKGSSGRRRVKRFAVSKTFAIDAGQLEQRASVVGKVEYLNKGVNCFVVTCLSSINWEV